jgi:hypothetical protein
MIPADLQQAAGADSFADGACAMNAIAAPAAPVTLYCAAMRAAEPLAGLGPAGHDRCRMMVGPSSGAVDPGSRRKRRRDADPPAAALLNRSRGREWAR